MKTMRKYFKIVNPQGHNGLIYHEGYNEDTLPFNPSGSCQPGGIYFAKKDIFCFFSYGTKIYEVKPIGEVYKNPDLPVKYKSHAVDLKYIGETDDSKAIKYLINAGADIHTGNEYPLRDACRNGHTEIIKILIKAGADIHTDNDKPLRNACYYGYTEIVKILIKAGADIHTDNDKPLRNACYNGHTEVVKILIEAGADSKVIEAID